MADRSAPGRGDLVVGLGWVAVCAASQATGGLESPVTLLFPVVCMAADRLPPGRLRLMVGASVGWMVLAFVTAGRPAFLGLLAYQVGLVVGTALVLRQAAAARQEQVGALEVERAQLVSLQASLRATEQGLLRGHRRDVLARRIRQLSGDINSLLFVVVSSVDPGPGEGEPLEEARREWTSLQAWSHAPAVAPTVDLAAALGTLREAVGVTCRAAAERLANDEPRLRDDLAVAASRLGDLLTELEMLARPDDPRDPR